jgi:hypothetical protein
MNVWMNKAVCVLALCMFLAGTYPVTAKTTSTVMDNQPRVLWEMCTKLGCLNCGPAHVFEEELNGTYGSDLVIMDLWTRSPDKNDTVAIQDRVSWLDKRYDTEGIDLPELYIDGIFQGAGTVSQSSSKSEINTRLGMTRDFAISVSGDIASGSVNVHLDKTGTGSYSNLKMRYILQEYNIHTTDAYGSPLSIAREARTMLPDDAVGSIPGGGLDFTKTFTLNPGWVTRNLSVIAFLQVDGTANDPPVEGDTSRQVLQTCEYLPGGTVTEITPVFVFAFGCIVAITIAVSGKKAAARRRIHDD